jgi:hypothetical protein
MGARKTFYTWTPEQDAKFRELVEAGTRYKEIAKLMNRSLNSVLSHTYYLGIKRCKSKAQVNIVESPKFAPLKSKKKRPVRVNSKTVVISSKSVKELKYIYNNESN